MDNADAKGCQSLVWVENGRWSLSLLFDADDPFHQDGPGAVAYVLLRTCVETNPTHQADCENS